MKKALWFSRHIPTQIQMDEIKEMGYTLEATEIAWGMDNGAIDIQEDAQVIEVIDKILTYVSNNKINIVFGVFPTPILNYAFRTAEGAVEWGDWWRPVALYAAWNVMRSIEGQKPTFTHKKWLPVGALSISTKYNA
jgi:hypothetical protein